MSKEPVVPPLSQPRGLKPAWNQAVFEKFSFEKFHNLFGKLEKSFGHPTKFAVGVTVAYFVVAMFGAMHHEMWNDEFQAWLIARDSGSFIDHVSRGKGGSLPAMESWIFRLMLAAFS